MMVLLWLARLWGGGPSLDGSAMSDISYILKKLHVDYRHLIKPLSGKPRVKSADVEMTADSLY